MRNELLPELPRGEGGQMIEKGIWGIHGLYSEITGEFRLTSLGERMAVFLENHPGYSIVVIRDVAHEVNGKPLEKSRCPRIRAYLPVMAEGLPKPPELDAYIVPGDEQLTLEQIAQELRGGKFIPRNRINITVKSGNRRPDHRYISVYTMADQRESDGKSWTQVERIRAQIEQRYPLAHLCFPRDEKGVESSDSSLLISLMAEDNCPPILLIPKYDGEKVIGIGGRQLNFFPSSEKHACWQNNKGEIYRPGIYYFPDLVFPKGNWPEALDGLMRIVKTAAWNNLLPIINRSEFEGRLFGPDDVLDVNRLIALARQTNFWIAENIVFVLSGNPSLLGEKKQRTANARHLMEKFFDSLDGDPEMSFLRFKAMGFFDRKGFLPKLGEYLKEGYREQKLKDKLAKCDGGKIGRGRKVFFDFLFEEIKDVRKALAVAALLKPVIYQGNDYDFVKDCLFWHDEDERFKPVLRGM